MTLIVPVALALILHLKSRMHAMMEKGTTTTIKFFKSPASRFVTSFYLFLSKKCLVGKFSLFFSIFLDLSRLNEMNYNGIRKSLTRPRTKKPPTCLVSPIPMTLDLLFSF